MRPYNRLVIIGRGVAGCFLALESIERGYETVLIGPKRGDGDASYVAQGFSIHKGLTLPESPFFALKIRGQSFTRKKIQAIELATGIECPKIEGVFEPFFSALDYFEIMQRIYRRKPEGLWQSSIKENYDLGTYKSRFMGLRHYPKDYWFSPQELLEQIEKLILKKGGQIKEEIYKGHLRTKNEALILCLGAKTIDYTRSLGLNIPQLFMKKGGVLEYGEGGAKPTFAFTRKGQGAVFGQFNRLFCEDPDLNPNECVNQNLNHFGLIPVESPAQQTKVLKVGNRLRTRKRFPLVGLELLPGVYLNTAFYKNGCELAPLAAKAIIDSFEGIGSEESQLFIHLAKIQLH